MVLSAFQHRLTIEIAATRNTNCLCWIRARDAAILCSQTILGLQQCSKFSFKPSSSLALAKRLGYLVISVGNIIFQNEERYGAENAMLNCKFANKKMERQMRFAVLVHLHTLLLLANAWAARLKAPHACTHLLKCKSNEINVQKSSIAFRHSALHFIFRQSVTIAVRPWSNFFHHLFLLH